MIGGFVCVLDELGGNRGAIVRPGEGNGVRAKKGSFRVEQGGEVDDPG